MGIMDLRAETPLQWFVLLLLSPIILPYQACKIFFCGCCGVYLYSAGVRLLCGVCMAMGRLYEDAQFPASAASLGKLDAAGRKIEWRRLARVLGRDTDADGAAKGEPPMLFRGRIEPDDIKQGSLGDCWLMACLASLSRYPAMISRLLLTKNYQPYGRYVVRLFDPRKNKWAKVVVSDHIPVDSADGKPLFANPNEGEAWVLLLEKAFAKMMGGYGALDGNMPAVGLAMLTGEPVLSFGTKDGGKTWIKHDVVYHSDVIAEAVYQWDTKAERFGPDRLFEVLLAYRRQGAVMITHCPGTDTDRGIHNLVPGHAYSLLNVKQVGQHRLLNLRNPWSTGEYTGPWSDNAPEWKQYPEVKAACKQIDADDGSFWLPFEVYLEFFGNRGYIDIASRSTGFNDLVLDVKEDLGCCGPYAGCFVGCFQFWCMCKGCWALLCGRRGTLRTAKTDGCCNCYCLEGHETAAAGDKNESRYKVSQFATG